jgi:homoserine dehydrogenase
MEIVKICVRDLKKARDFEVDPAVTTFTTNYDDILEDKSINCVIELMGGTTRAKDVVFKAIANGKDVVTANKALIANYLPELLALLDANPAVRFTYEAAVCGGIPIIRALHSDFLSDSITKVMGIMNGTTNFMLCKMEDEGADYGDVLIEAQALGYAEADPTADVEGHDVQAKIALLAKLCFGISVPFADVPTTGISSITSADFAYAKTLKSTIKLLGTANQNADGTLAVFVSACMVPLTSPLASAKGPGNMVLINSENNTQSTFAGPGAGRFPTANSVMSDLIRLSQNISCDPFPVADPGIVLDPDYSSRFYVRIKCSDGLGIIRKVGEAAELAGVSVHAILQNPIVDRTCFDFVVTTEMVELSKVHAFAESVAVMDFSLEKPLFMPML